MYIGISSTEIQLLFASPVTLSRMELAAPTTNLVAKCRKSHHEMWIPFYICLKHSLQALSKAMNCSKPHFPHWQKSGLPALTKGLQSSFHQCLASVWDPLDGECCRSAQYTLHRFISLAPRIQQHFPCYCYNITAVVLQAIIYRKKWVESYFYLLPSNLFILSSLSDVPVFWSATATLLGQFKQERTDEVFSAAEISWQDYHPHANATTDQKAFQKDL